MPIPVYLWLLLAVMTAAGLTVALISGFGLPVAGVATVAVAASLILRWLR